MSGYKIVGFNIIDFKGIETCQYNWKDNEGLVVVGGHGEGKSNVIEALNVLLEGAKALKKIDNPVHIGAKKYKIEADFKGSGDALACYDIGSEFRVTATQSTSGIQQLKIENLGDDGRPVKASCRDILKTLRGLYVDPHQLMIDLGEHNGDQKLAASVLKNIGLNLSEFEEKEAELAVQWSADNEEVGRNRKVIESIDIPTEGFPKQKIDVQKLWDENQAYKEFKERNQGSDTKKAVLESSLKRVSESVQFETEKLKVQNGSLEALTGLVQLASSEVFNIQTAGIQSFRGIANGSDPYQDIVDKLKYSIVDFDKKVNEAIEYHKVKLNDRQFEEKSVLELKQKIEKLELEVVGIKSEIEQSGKPEEWTGLKDETGELSPDQFITKSIQDAQIHNALFLKKDEYTKAEQNLKAAELSRDKTSQLRKDNNESRTKAVAGADFQVDGLSVNENGALTAKVDGRPVVTLKDLNHADKLRVLSDILMVNNDKPLKLIVIKEGYACKPEYQKIIFDQARKHGYTAIMESFTSVEDEGCLYMKDGMSSDTPPVDLGVFESEENTEKIPGEPDWG